MDLRDVEFLVQFYPSARRTQQGHCFCGLEQAPWHTPETRTPSVPHLQPPLSSIVVLRPPTASILHTSSFPLWTWGLWPPPW